MEEKFAYEITEQDFIDFQLFVYKTNNKKKTNFLRANLFSLVMIIFSVFMLIIVINSSNKGSIYISIFSSTTIIFILLVLFRDKLITNSIVTQCKKYISNGSASSVIGKMEIILKEDQITFIDPISSSVVDIQNFKKVLNNENCYYFLKMTYQLFW